MSGLSLFKDTFGRIKPVEHFKGCFFHLVNKVEENNCKSQSFFQLLSHKTISVHLKEKQYPSGKELSFPNCSFDDGD